MTPREEFEKDLRELILFFLQGRAPVKNWNLNNLYGRELQALLNFIYKYSEKEFVWVSVQQSLPPLGKVVLLKQTYPEGTLFNCRSDPLERVFYKIGGITNSGEFVDNHCYKKIEDVSHWKYIDG